MFPWYHAVHLLGHVSQQKTWRHKIQTRIEITHWKICWREIIHNLQRPNMDSFPRLLGVISTAIFDICLYSLQVSPSSLFFFVPGLSRHLGYGRLASSSILPCLLRCPLSTLPVSYLSYTHLSILGLAALFFFSLVCLHLAFFSRCAPLSFSSHGRMVFPVIFFNSWTTLVVPLMCSFRILSLLVTPHILLSILISFTSSRASRPLVVAQVSAPYNRAGLTTVL